MSIITTTPRFVTPFSWLISHDPLDATIEYPFKYLTRDELVNLATMRPTWSYVRPANLILLYVLFPLGVIGNALIILTILLGKRNERKEIFDKCILAIAVVDLIFILLKLPYSYVGTIVSTWVPFLAATSAVMYSFSMFSDLLILLLTIDRFCGIIHPIAHETHPRVRSRLWMFAVFVAALLSCTRLQYAIDGDAACEVTAPWYDPVMCKLKVNLTYFSDFLAPSIYAGVMLLLVTMMLVALWKRSKKMFTTSVQNEVYEQFRSTRSLLVVLTVMYFCNQVGYMFYSIAYTCFKNTPISFESTFYEAYSFMRAKQVYEFSNFFSNLLEVFSRAMAFYPYVVFNCSFRENFKSIFKKKTTNGRVGPI